MVDLLVFVLKLLLVIIVTGGAFYVIRIGINSLDLGEPAKKIANVVLVIFAVVVAVLFLIALLYWIPGPHAGSPVFLP